MSNARNLADIITGNFDVPLGALDNVPPSNDASALTTGTLPVGRLPSSGVSASSLTTGTLPVGRLADGSINPLKFSEKGVPFNTKFFYYNVRTGLPVQASYTLWSVNYNKKSATSIIVFDVQLAFRDSYNGEVGFYVQYGSSANSYRGCSYMESGGGGNSYNDSDTKQFFRTSIDGYTTTGSQTVNVGWSSYNGGANMPSSIWNPTDADDGRGRSPGSTLVIWEIEP